MPTPDFQLRKSRAPGPFNPAARRLLCAGALALAAAAPARAQSLIQTIGVGTNPAKVAVNPVTGNVYVGNSAGTLSVISGATHAVTSLPVAGNVVDLAVNPVNNKIYAVVNNGIATAGSLVVINGATGTIASTVAVGTNPVAVALDPVTSRVFVVIQRTNSLVVVNSNDDSIVTTVALTLANHLNAIGINPVTHYVYVAAGTGGASGSIEVVDGQVLTFVRRFILGLNNFPVTVAVNCVTNKIYALQSQQFIYVLNGETAAIPATLGASVVYAAATLSGLAVNPVNNKIYVGNDFNHTLEVINGATGATAASKGPSVAMTANANPGAVAVDSSSNLVLVNDPVDNRVYVLNGASNTFFYNTTLPQTTGAIGVNPVTGHFYVALPANSGLAAFDIRYNANSSSSTVAGGSPVAAISNPVSGKTYLANTGSNSITVVSPGSANKDVPLGGAPANFKQALAHNPITNRIYALLDNGAAAGSLKVLDGAADTILATVPVGIRPAAVDVNPVDNRIYVANQTDQTVTVIDGAANSVVATLPFTITGGTVAGLAANPATHRIYVLVTGGLMVVDGATNVLTTALSSTACAGLAVNRVTGKVYIARTDAGVITVVDDATLAVSTIPVGNPGQLIAVNEASNKIYMADGSIPNQLQIVNGAGSGALLTTLAVGNAVTGIAINANANIIYLTDASGYLFLVDGITDSSRLTVNTGMPSPVVAVNPVAGQLVYAVGSGAGNIHMLTEKPVADIPLDVTIGALAGNTAATTTPYFSFTAASTYSPTAPPPQQVHYQVDGWQGPWLPATYFFGSWSATLPPLGYGTHTLYAWADDGQASTSINPASSPVIGQVAAYTFVVVPGAPAITAQPGNQSVCNLARATFTVTATGGTLSYQWRRSGLNLTDGGNVSGSLAATLALDPVSTANAGTFDVLVTGTQSGYATSTLSNPATLTVDGAHSPPSEVPYLYVVKGSPDQLQWLAPTNSGGYTVSYDVLRSTVNGNFTNTLTTTCVFSGIPGTAAPDGYSGNAYYLIRARNACGSTLGFASSGAPIQGRSCP